MPVDYGRILYSRFAAMEHPELCCRASVIQKHPHIIARELQGFPGNAIPGRISVFLLKEGLQSFLVNASIA